MIATVESLSMSISIAEQCGINGIKQQLRVFASTQSRDLGADWRDYSYSTRKYPPPCPFTTYQLLSAPLGSLLASLSLVRRCRFRRLLDVLVRPGDRGAPVSVVRLQGCPKFDLTEAHGFITSSYYGHPVGHC